MSERKPSAIDLFSGCGGLTEGLRRAGFNVVGAIDVDPLSVETYKRNHPGAAVWETDIRRLTVKEVMTTLHIRAGELDLLAGCPPCQGFSSIRTLNRARRIRARKQKNLVFEFLRFVRMLKPKTIMMENVPGLMSDRRTGTLRRKLRRLGYKCNVKVLNAARFGVPQRRRRMILLGGFRRPIDFADPTRKIRTVRDAIGSLPLPGKNRDPLHISAEKRKDRIIRLIRSIPKNGGSRTDLSKRRQLPCHRRCDGFKDVYGRMAWDDVAPTITGGCVNPSKGRFLHPSQNRTITLREAALLQGFRKRYYFSLSRGKFKTAMMIGNALPPEFIRRHAVRIRKFLDTPGQPA